jgi:hypothetical protein
MGARLRELPRLAPAVGLCLMCIAAALSADSTAPTLVIFGGSGHQTYLGCLSCDTDHQESIFNSAGQFGSCTGPQPKSLFCRLTVLSEFSNSHSNYSACNSSARDPPVIVDHEGNYYGRFLSSTLALSHEDSVCGRGRYRNEVICGIAAWVCNQ